jgi:hypothetical protein
LPEEFDQSFIDRPELESSTADPVGERRPVEIDPLTGVDLRLPIKR